ncbi:MAG: rubredoxin [Gloeobacterales cyanobacterium]
MTVRKCTSCGYTYDPSKGDSDLDPDAGIPPVPPVEILTNEWICPACGATNEEFEPD